VSLSAGVGLLLHDANAAVATGGGAAERKLLHSHDRGRLRFEAGVRFLGVPHNLALNGAAPAQPRESGIENVTKPVFRFVLSLLVGRTGYVPHGSTLPLECQEG
jgi:hypothetical protein